MRVKMTVSLDSELAENIKKLSQRTRIPASRLFDEALEDLLKKHEKHSEDRDDYRPKKRELI